MRFTVPFVKIEHERPPLYPNHRALLVRGNDTHRLNKLQPPPAE
jgi:hypothetical protein